MTATAEAATVPARTSRRKINWDVLRVTAVLAVVVQHATHAGRVNHPELGPSPLHFPLQIGASSLVVISAFFACASLAKGRPGHFLRNRVARLLPPYLAAVLLTYGVLVGFAPPGWSALTPRDIVGNLLLLQNWVPGIRFVDHSYWTLPVQITGFLAAAALFASSFGAGRGLRAVLWLLPTGPLLVRLFVDDLAWLRVLFQGLAMHRAQLFAVGVALWLWSRGRLPGWQLAALTGLSLYAQYVQSADGPSTVGLAVLVAVMVAAAGGPDWYGVLPTVVVRAVRWLAGISYGVYLLNQEIGYLLMYRVHQLGGGALPQVAVAVTAAVLSGWLLTVLVERPAHRVLMRGTWLGPRTAAALRWLVAGNAVPRPPHPEEPALVLVASQLR